MADTGEAMGALKVIDTGTILKYEYGGTVRMIINKSTGAVTFGSVDGIGAAIVRAGTVFFTQLWAEGDASTGVVTLDASGDGIVNTDVICDAADILLALPKDPTVGILTGKVTGTNELYVGTGNAADSGIEVQFLIIRKN